MVQRFRPNKWKDCDGDWFTTGVEEHPEGKYVLYSDYKSTLDKLAEKECALEESATRITKLEKTLAFILYDDDWQAMYEREDNGLHQIINHIVSNIKKE